MERGKWRRGWWLAAAPVALVVAVPLAYGPLVAELGGDWRREVGPYEEALSAEARALVARALEGLELGRVVDLHVHVAGLGTGGTGCEVNPDLLSWMHPLERGRFDLYLSACGVDDMAHADQQAIERLTDLLTRPPVAWRAGLLAFDRFHDAEGRPDPARSVFHVPDDYVLELAGARPELFLPVISVHPYRDDALEELERCAGRGAKVLKWLPNAMNIDPASPRCDAFYAKLRELGIVLLSHTGVEHAVPAAELQAYGNPLLLRRALDAGVRVIAAHCATLGESVDLDDPARPTVPSFELFLRLMDEPRYAGLFFGDLSAIVLRNRDPERIAKLLAREDLHARLVYGSDYPLPAMDVVISASWLAGHGLLDPAEAPLLEEVYEYDPLLFDLVLKRRLRSPETGRGFAAEAFHVPAEWGL